MAKSCGEYKYRTDRDRVVTAFNKISFASQYPPWNYVSTWLKCRLLFDKTKKNKVPCMESFVKLSLIFFHTNFGPLKKVLISQSDIKDEKKTEFQWKKSWRRPTNQSYANKIRKCFPAETCKILQEFCFLISLMLLWKPAKLYKILINTWRNCIASGKYFALMIVYETPKIMLKVLCSLWNLIKVSSSFN